MYSITEIDEKPAFNSSINGARFAKANIVTKVCPTEREARIENYAMILASLAGLNCPPGFAIKNRWSSVFIPGFSTFGSLGDSEAFDLIVTNPRKFARMFAFDFMISNTDRHSSNFGIVDDDIFIIDHGISMGSENFLPVVSPTLHYRFSTQEWNDICEIIEDFVHEEWERLRNIFTTSVINSIFSNDPGCGAVVAANLAFEKLELKTYH